ncbi:MAG: hypothetical protein J6B87_05360 [Clostridia bacterium]|nr:hypothetical protein [Clostridia bacterium]
MAYSYSDLFKQLGLDKHIKDADRVAAEIKSLKLEHDKTKNGPSMSPKPRKDMYER